MAGRGPGRGGAGDSSRVLVRLSYERTERLELEVRDFMDGLLGGSS